VEGVVSKEEVFFDHKERSLFLKKRRVLKELMWKNQVRGFHVFLFLLQRSLQYLTSSQFFSHFLRQLKGLWQTGQFF
jgi:hypothetical protein